MAPYTYTHTDTLYSHTKFNSIQNFNVLLLYRISASKYTHGSLHKCVVLYNSNLSISNTNLTSNSVVINLRNSQMFRRGDTLFNSHLQTFRCRVWYISCIQTLLSVLRYSLKCNCCSFSVSSRYLGNSCDAIHDGYIPVLQLKRARACACACACDSARPLGHAKHPFARSIPGARIPLTRIFFPPSEPK